MDNQNNNRPASTRVSFPLMALTVVSCILAIVFIVALPNHLMGSRGWLIILAVIAALAIASNQAVYSVTDIATNRLCGIDGLARALTQCAAPLAAVVIAFVVAENYSWWHLFGFTPLVGLGLLGRGDTPQQ